MNPFEFDGEKYKQASKHQKEWGTKLISELELSGNEAILDLGCGDGVLTEQLSTLVPNGKVVGIDASVGMLETAKKHVKDNLHFICMDINELDFENHFDIIFSNAALHWIKNHPKLLQNSLKALKPNGIIRWNFASDGTCLHFFDTIQTAMKEAAFKEYFHDFEWPWFMPSKDEYEKTMAEAGFSKAHIWSENVDRYFSNGDEMIQWIEQPSLVPFIRQIPEEKKEAFRNWVVERMIEKTKQPDGRHFETFRRLNVKATK